MSQVYIVKKGSETVPMTRVRCANEDLELQLLLEKTPQLMPGDQIRPEDPRRWLLIKREMPVPDPSSGENRWSIDHFFVDQSGMPTFVECKRFLDTRSRREVVGQMLDYAANGQFYWDKNQMRDYAEMVSKERGVELETALREMNYEADSVDAFFETIESNLREGQVRLIFFMEEAPQELKSVVDFLNKQMDRSEVLIVEAKQFEEDGMRVVAPALFGYTEEARRVKRTVKVSKDVVARKWDEERFFQVLQDNFSADKSQPFRKLLEYAKTQNCQIRWGAGKVDGSFSVVGSGDLNKTLMSVYTSGWISFPLGGMVGSEHIEAFRDELARLLDEELHFELPDDVKNKFPGIRMEHWTPKVEKLISVFFDLLEKY